MHCIDVDTERPYRVHLGTRLLERTGELVRGLVDGDMAAIVTDTNVGPLYESIVRASLEAAGFACCTFVFEAGEERKRAATYLELVEFLAEEGLCRRDAVIALGGGVTGDLAGFAAATYLRGIPYIQMPTSLLAMVDSSVGGKTAIDLSTGKNLVGSFWQPAAVIADIGCLATLEPAQFADGCGEVVKHASIADAELFAVLEETPLTLELLSSDLARAEAVVARNIDIKRAVVAADEREGGVRKLLNFGHTVGHAVELLEEYRLGHGTCVAVGMSVMARAAAANGVCDGSVPERIEALCAAHGLDTACRWSATQIAEAAVHDKKRQGDGIDVVIPHAIGACSIDRLPLTDFAALVRDGLGEEPCAC